MINFQEILMKIMRIAFKRCTAKNWTLMKVFKQLPFKLNLLLDEVPIILHELNDSAIHFISRD